LQNWQYIFSLLQFRHIVVIRISWIRVRSRDRSGRHRLLGDSPVSVGPAGGLRLRLDRQTVAQRQRFVGRRRDALGRLLWQRRLRRRFLEAVQWQAVGAPKDFHETSSRWKTSCKPAQRRDRTNGLFFLRLCIFLSVFPAFLIVLTNFQTFWDNDHFLHNVSIKLELAALVTKF